jgi:mono/diheme cytochrome c family protein
MSREVAERGRFDCRIRVPDDPGSFGEAAWQMEAKFHAGTRGVVRILAAAALAYATASVAQDETKVKAGLELWKSSGCADCHGAFADGDKARDEAPTGANLRTSRLDTAGLKQTISCGRPGADMPSFDEGAYTVRACAGRPLGAAPDNLYPASSKLSPAEIDTLVTYLQARIIGRGRITRDECLYYYYYYYYYYDGLSSSCDDLK